MSLTFFPGFGLTNDIYTRLEVSGNKNCIDIVPDTTWDKTLSNIACKIESGSIAVGYSMGARICLGLTMQNPHLFKGLVLISVNAGLDGEEKQKRKLLDEDNVELIRNNPDEFFYLFDKQAMFDTSNTTSDLSHKYRIADSETIANQLEVLGLGTMPNYSKRLIEIPIPVLYISGSRDPKYIELAKLYSSNTAYSFNKVIDSDHRVPLNSPRILSKYIEWFANYAL